MQRNMPLNLSLTWIEMETSKNIEVNGRSCLHCDQPRWHQTGLAQIAHKLYEVGDQREQVTRKHCMLCQRLGDETIYLSDCFEWSWNWISALTYTICGVNEIYQQLSRTRVREEMTGLTSGKLFLNVPSIS